MPIVLSHWTIYWRFCHVESCLNFLNFSFKIMVICNLVSVLSCRLLTRQNTHVRYNNVSFMLLLNYFSTFMSSKDRIFFFQLLVMLTVSLTKCWKNCRKIKEINNGKNNIVASSNRIQGHLKTRPLLKISFVFRFTCKPVCVVNTLQ